ncbi:hypothetical protein GLOIN_2v1791191 [Rhizophagus irregularis DAOM 181602=DAOM 197198]|nr:hypothetical protein GLOIN_2v1791191 [Rhizophagus irregularis DAOM 181602=DAOM 197198]
MRIHIVSLEILSTIPYISEYREKTSSEFFVGMATGYTRLEGDSDATQIFNITVFYPLKNHAIIRNLYIYNKYIAYL